MPYKTISDLPEDVRKKGEKSARQFLSVYNKVFRETQDETQAVRAAHGAIKASDATIADIFRLPVDKGDGPLLFLFADSLPVFDPAGRSVVEVMRTGEWHGHESGEQIKINGPKMAELLANWERTGRRCVLDYDHGTDYGTTAHDRRAAGWLRDLWVVDSYDNKVMPAVAQANPLKEYRLLGLYEVTEEANRYIESGEYGLYSPTFVLDYKDKTSGKKVGLTLLRGAITNAPFFDRQTGFIPIAASERALVRFRSKSSSTQGEHPASRTVRGNEEGTTSPQSEKESTMGWDKALAAPLRLSETAPDHEFRARVEGLILLAEKAPKEGEEVIKTSELQAMREKTEVIRLAERRRVVQGAIDAFKIKKAGEADWNKKYDEDPKVTEILLASIVGRGTDPTKEIGAAGGDPEGSESATVQVMSLVEKTQKELKLTVIEATRHVERAHPGLYVRMRAENTRVIRTDPPTDEEGSEK